VNTAESVSKHLYSVHTCTYISTHDTSLVQATPTAKKAHTPAHARMHESAATSLLWNPSPTEMVDSSKKDGDTSAVPREPKKRSQAAERLSHLPCPTHQVRPSAAAIAPCTSPKHRFWPSAPKELQHVAEAIAVKHCITLHALWKGERHPAFRGPALLCVALVIQHHCGQTFGTYLGGWEGRHL